MPWTLPDSGRRGRVHVAVRVDPDEPDRLAAARDEVRRGADRAGRKRVVAARAVEGKRAGGMGLVDLAVQPLTDPRDFTDVPLLRVAGGARLRDGRRQVALVDDGEALHGRDTLAEARDPDGRRAHVDAPTAPAEVERHTEDVDEAGRAERAPTKIMAFARRNPSLGLRGLAANS